MNGQKTTPDVGIEMPASKVSSAESGPISGPLMMNAGTDRAQQVRRRTEVAHALIRLFCLFSSCVAVAFMASAEQDASISLYGFKLPVSSKWSFSPSFEYLVGISAAAAAHSLLQLLLCAMKLVKKDPAIPSRNHAWLIFAGDQVFAYAMMSAGSAASGVTNLNRTGIRHSPLPNFCAPLHKFCDHVAVSITFTFFSCFLLATSAVLDVIWLSKN